MVEKSVIKLAYRGIDYFISLIQQEIPFSFPRYGDGEFSSILGYHGQNCDGIKYTDELREALTETLRYPHLNETYYYGLLAIAIRFFKPYIERFTIANNLDIMWTEATFLVAANRHGRLAPLLAALQPRPMLYVGPSYLKDVGRVLGLDIPYFIEIPEKTAFQDRESIKNKVLVYADVADFVGFEVAYLVTIS
ncbi:MAG: hypothetical protein ACXABD_21180 [Candidatus Thorarchaeota archaeon]|jgi:hypothetical protein